jgi:hypothetical protein
MGGRPKNLADVRNHRVQVQLWAEVSVVLFLRCLSRDSKKSFLRPWVTSTSHSGLSDSARELEISFQETFLAPKIVLANSNDEQA